MQESYPIIVDDVEVALSYMSDLGQAIVGPTALSIRQHILTFASAAGWKVVHYSKFQEWIASLASEGEWICLDPLQERSGFGRFLRISRAGVEQGHSIDPDHATTLSTWVAGMRVGLIDDLAATGSTIDYVTDLVASLGGSVTRVALCAASAASQSRIGSRWPDITWRMFASGAHRAIHLRDACPYLPFAGRRVGTQLPLVVNGLKIDVRAPSNVMKLGLWENVYRDYRVLHATTMARVFVADRFSAALSRDATVCDLPALGENVAVPAYPRHTVSTASTLASLLQ